MPAISINGFEMHCEVRGKGQPLLLLHGGMGIGADWKHIFATDPEGYRVIVPDLRGHGRSSNPARSFTFKQCAKDVIALLDHLEITTAKAIGMSMGAKTLLHVATMQPNRLEAMVLVSATPHFPRQLRDAAVKYTRESFEKLSDAEANFLRSRHIHGDEQILQLYDMARSFASSYDDMAFTSELLGTIMARTLIVHGDRDPLYPVELAIELFRGISNSKLWVVPNGGHGPIFGEFAPQFAAIALKHLGGESMSR
jgi:pimeloyl-ACP methyl ester carboxylesterase